MKKLLCLALLGLPAVAVAQTPAVNLMPDGSRDMYVGVGAIVQPRYEGARERRTRAAPLLQVEFSNGVFLSGMSAGWHLSQQPSLEFGPLLALEPGRDSAGVRGVILPTTASFAGADDVRDRNVRAKLPDIKARLTAGVFLNYYLAPQVRLNNAVLYGAGGNGLVWEMSVQKMAPEMTAPHRVSLSAGVSVVNRAYKQAFFGQHVEPFSLVPLPAHEAQGGVKDVFVGARWNWALSPSWIVSTSARASRLSGDVRKSPLVERAGQFSISTGLAHRF